MSSIKRGSLFAATFLLLFLTILKASATDVFFDVTTVFGTQPPNNTNRIFRLQSLSPFGGNYFWRTSDVSGQFYVSNALATTYSGTMLAPPNSLTFSFYVSATNLGTIPAEGITAIPANTVNTFPSGQTAYSAQAADIRFAPNASGPFAGLTAIQTTNLVQNVTNGMTSIVYSNAELFAGTNLVAITSNGIVAQFPSSGISDITATNIATNQVFLGTNTALVLNKMSSGSGNEYGDMMTATNSHDGAMGYSYTSPSAGYDFWAASGSGLGSNVWGSPINLPGGSTYIGNPFWQDLPATSYHQQGVYFGFGPAASAATNVFPFGHTNIWPASDNAFQPYFQVVNANPYGGGAGILIRSGSTNATHGSLVGKDSSGKNIYLDQYGMAILDLTGEPYGVYSNGVLTAEGIEAQQVPSHNIIQSENAADFDISLNGQRPGDDYVGQIPLFSITHTNPILNIVAGFPKQVANVWMPRNSKWLWALGVDELSGNVFATNGIFYVSNIVATSTNLNAFNFGTGNPYAVDALFNVNGSAHFGIPSTPPFNYQGAFTFDTSGNNRLGVVIQSGLYPQMGHAAGSPFIIAQYGTNDLQKTGASTTVTNEIVIGSDSTVTVPFAMTNGGGIYLSGGAFNGDGSSITNIKHGNTVSFASGGTATPSLNVDGSTNFSLSVSIAITNAIGTNYPNGNLANQTLYYPTNDLSLKANTNSPVIYSAVLIGGGTTNQNITNAFAWGPFDWGIGFPSALNPDGSIDLGGGNAQINADGSATFAGGKVTILANGNISTTGGINAANSGISNAVFSGNGAGITNILASDISTNGSSSGQVLTSLNGNTAWTNVSAVIPTGITNAIGTNFPNGNVANQILYYPTNFVNPTNGFAINPTFTNNTTIEGQIAFGPLGGATNFYSSTNILKVFNAGSSIATNGTLIWSSALNCYTNWSTGAIYTNSGSAWLLQTNGVTLYTVSGSNPAGNSTAVGGFAPPPTVVVSGYFDGNGIAWLGPLSVTNITSISNSIYTNITIVTTNSYVANLNGFATNTFITNAVLSWAGAPAVNFVDNGASVNFGALAAGMRNQTLLSGFGAAILSGSSNLISADGAAVICGGTSNVIFGGSGNADAILSGAYNRLIGSAGISSVDANVIAGGMSNSVNTVSIFSSISGGYLNANNSAGYASIIGGLANTNLQIGAVILGGNTNRNKGLWSVAAGRNVTITNDNVFDWSDGIPDTSYTNSQARLTATNGLYVNGPIWAATANTNSGIYIRSNTFSIWAVTNSWASGDTWYGNSNGVPVILWNSNNVPVMKNQFP